jgi:hypothetical protein
VPGGNTDRPKSWHTCLHEKEDSLPCLHALKGILSGGGADHKQFFLKFSQNNRQISVFCAPGYPGSKIAAARFNGREPH